MKRLTTDIPDGNFETMLNFVFDKDGWAHIRHDGSEGTVPLTQWAKAQCILHGCAEFPAETPEEIDEEICDCLTMDFPDCPIALAYGFAVQACHLRDRLKMYEDVLFAEDGTERLTLNGLRNLSQPNDPLTLEELRKMDGKPVWLLPIQFGVPYGYWGIVSEILDDGVRFSTEKDPYDFAASSLYGVTWIAYRHKPEEGVS